MKYSFNLDKEGIVFAQRYNINASYKDLCAACDAVRYMKVSNALAALDGIITMRMPILYRKFSRHMGARHELGGRKGAYPVKIGIKVRLALLNAMGNAKNNGLDGEGMIIIHSSANKTRIERRYPSKGSISWGRGMYGRGATNHSDIEYAKVEIGLGQGDEKAITDNMRYFIRQKSGQWAKETNAGYRSE
ncbi:MAG: hypothetical protein M1305_01760, partial [Candidatus Marsarchaeota archaeon]|nr:hypothetical protein [Candidatus Marsarchaeota archaeon]